MAQDRVQLYSRLVRLCHSFEGVDIRMIDRVFLIVLDGVGIGELPDAHRYGDNGSDTIRNTARAVGGLHLPVLERLGLGCLGNIEGVSCTKDPEASYGRMAEKSPGKDTTTGHWEIAGLILDQPFPVYPNGFPQDLLAKFSSAIGREKPLRNIIRM